MRAARRLHRPLAIAAIVITVVCLVSSAPAQGSSRRLVPRLADNGDILFGFIDTDCYFASPGVGRSAGDIAPSCPGGYYDPSMFVGELWDSGIRSGGPMYWDTWKYFPYGAVNTLSIPELSLTRRSDSGGTPFNMGYQVGGAPACESWNDTWSPSQGMGGQPVGAWHVEWLPLSLWGGEYSDDSYYDPIRDVTVYNVKTWSGAPGASHPTTLTAHLTGSVDGVTSTIEASVNIAWPECGDGEYKQGTLTAEKARLLPAQPPVPEPKKRFGPPSDRYARPTTETYADPVNTGTGNFYHQETDASLDGPGISFALQRTYNSLDEASGPFGKGWSASTIPSLTVDGAGNAQFRADTGQRIEYVLQPDGLLCG